MKRKEPLVRFWSKVVKQSKVSSQHVSTPCWDWAGTRNWLGYGEFKVGRKLHGAHRWIYMQINGPLPSGYNVCHRCDNPGCVNPDHLFPGTQSENLKDSASKGRHQHQKTNERNPSRKLTWDQAREIKRLIKDGVTQKAIANWFRVSPTAIGSIARNRTWREQ